MSETDNLEIVLPDPFARLPELAARLGVPPLEGGHTVAIVIATASGEQYDLFGLIGAFLDRLDRVTS